jgi:hypothetical protein
MDHKGWIRRILADFDTLLKTGEAANISDVVSLTGDIGIIEVGFGIDMSMIIAIPLDFSQQLTHAFTNVTIKQEGLFYIIDG